MKKLLATGKVQTLISSVVLHGRACCPVGLLEESIGAGGCLESAGMLLVS